VSRTPRSVRAELLSRLAEKIVAHRGDKPLKVAIDGRCGAGKTTFADELGRELKARGFPILRPSVDGFHHPSERRYRQGALSAKGYYEDAFDNEKIIEYLLVPLSGREFPAPCRLASFDYRAERTDDSSPLLVERGAILLFDGLFLFRRELDAFWDFRILLFVDSEVSLARALPRDEANGVGTIEEMKRRYAQRYEPAWQIYEREENPSLKADAIIDNCDIDVPRLLKLPA